MALLDYLKQKLSVKSETETKQTYAEEKIKARRQLIGSLILVVLAIIFFTIVFDKTPRQLNQSYINSHISGNNNLQSGNLPNKVFDKNLNKTTNKTANTADVDAKVLEQKEILKNLFTSKGKSNSPTVTSPKLTIDSLEKEKSSNQGSVAIKRDIVTTTQSASSTKIGNAEPASVKLTDKEKRKNEIRKAQDILNGKKMVVQIGAFSDPVKARAMQLKAERAGVAMVTILSTNKSITRVRTKVINNTVDAEEIAKKLQRAGLDTQIIQFKD